MCQGLRARRPGRKWVSGLLAKIGNQIGPEIGPRITRGKQIGPEIGFSPDFLFWGYFSLVSYFGTYLFSYCDSGTYFGTYLVSYLARRPETHFLPGRLARKPWHIVYSNFGQGGTLYQTSHPLSAHRC